MATKPLTGRNAIVTGSTQGIGLGIAKCLVEAGCSLLIHGSRPKERAKEAIDTLTAVANKSQIIDYCQADLSKPSVGCPKIIEQAKAVFGGKIHILVHNAGIQHVDPIDKFPLDAWDRLISIHLTSGFLLTKLVVPIMKAEDWGRIINISSVHGKVASVGKAAYCAAKHGLNGLTKVVALDLADTAVTCNAICPGWVHTPLVQKQVLALGKKRNLSEADATKALLSEKTPTKRFVTCDEIGGMVTFLCSPAANNITGSEMMMDGGWSAV
mmetsp:Transcript_18373/g.20423  ORF Transcript_18373/g.20423 Transcript_18373/m.20423 type:complete len:269 (+) Transcript_18373:15-821(+)